MVQKTHNTHNAVWLLIFEGSYVYSLWQRISIYNDSHNKSVIRMTRIQKSSHDRKLILFEAMNGSKLARSSPALAFFLTGGQLENWAFLRTTCCFTASGKNFIAFLTTAAKTGEQRRSIMRIDRNPNRLLLLRQTVLILMRWIEYINSSTIHEMKKAIGLAR
jgi:hypothetical protein